MAAKFLSLPRQADLSDIDGELWINKSEDDRPNRAFISPCIFPDELGNILKELFNRKAPRPDKIINQGLKSVRECIQEDLADVITRQLEDGTMPKELKETATVALRKPGIIDHTINPMARMTGYRMSS